MLLLLSLAAHAESPVAVRPWGFVKPGFTYTQEEGRAAAPVGFGFYGELGLDGSYEAARVAARLSLALDTSLHLQDAVLLWQPIPYLRLDAGQFRVPIGVGYLASESRRLLPAPALALAEVSRVDFGAELSGFVVIQDRSYAQLAAGVFNGEGPNVFRNDNPTFLFAQRVLITPLGARTKVFEGTDGVAYLGFGGAWIRNGVGEGVDTTEEDHFSGDVQFALGVLSAQGEIFAGDKFVADGSSARFLGGYGQLGTFIPAGWFGSHVEFVGRVGTHDPDTQSTGSAAGGGTPARVEITAGLNVYAFEDAARFHDLKVQFSYTHFLELEGSAVADDAVSMVGVARF